MTRFATLGPAPEQVTADVVVVGGGVAGLCAAVAAARAGARTALVTDRPVLGGNCSSEIRVGMNGAAYAPFNLWARETGLVEEIRNRHAALWSGAPDTYWATMDRVYFDLVAGEPLLRLFLNTTVLAAACGRDRTITAVEGLQLRAERRFRFAGWCFVDCSGDGVLAPLTGADFRHGREARAEFGERLAPPRADGKTMGATLLWTTRDAGRPVPFRAPAWALDVRDLPCLARHGSDPTRWIHVPSDGRFHGLWWAEYGGELDTIRDDAEIAWHTRRLVYGIWDWIKNSGRLQGVENLELDWVAALPGKRESRRLLGPVILTEHDWRKQTRFPDAVAHTGWPIDIHPPGGYRDRAPGCTHVWLPGPSAIPLRALFSRNVRNLLFAGRNLSATHVALGSPRVIATTGAMGQAVGVTAALCARWRVWPRDIVLELDPPSTTSRFRRPPRDALRQVQHALLRQDQSILGMALDEPHDLVRQASIRASSVRSFKVSRGERLIALGPGDFRPMPSRLVDREVPIWFSGSAGTIAAIPAATTLQAVWFRFFGGGGRRVRMDVYRTQRPENYRLDRRVAIVRAKVRRDGWARFPLGLTPGPGLKYLCHFPVQRGLALWATSRLIPGVAEARLWRQPGRKLWDLEPSRTLLTPCFRVEPDQNLLAPECVADGHIRPYGLPHLWSSAAMRPGRPEWLEIAWPRPVTVRRVELVFDTQLNGERPARFATLVRHYELCGWGPTVRGVRLIAEKDNALRFRRHLFPVVRLTRLRLVIHATHGSPYAGVYALRAYSR